MTYQLHSDASAQQEAGRQTNDAGGNGTIETTMLVNNPHNLIGGKDNGGVDEF
jgi:hypothetical protein